MSFQTIHTTYGLQRLVAAELTRTAINLTHVAVGDGGGNATAPSESQTQLVRERYRAPVNRVYQLPDRPGSFVAELVIPATIGGFTLRELGVFDDIGNLFVVGNLPDTYKPTGDDGAFSDTVLRIEFSAQNASVITLKVDPHVAVATQAWIINNITAATMIPGGTTAQIATKRSNADGDIVWRDPDAINVTVDTIEETQTLAAGQTVVDLVATTTRGLALYVEGVRLRRNQWAPHASLLTRLTLAASYPVGTRLIAAQNEPTGNAPAPLERSKNLADVEDKAAARTNLGIYSKDEADRFAPPGNIAYTARTTAPPGWLKANGAAVSRTAFAALFAAIGTKYGVGDGFNTFNLPDYRGLHLRGWDDGRGVDPGRASGSLQDSQNRSHGHGARTGAAGSHRHSVRTPMPAPDIDRGSNPSHWSVDSTVDAWTSAAGEHDHIVYVDASGGSEVRVINMAELAIIKY